MSSALGMDKGANLHSDRGASGPLYLHSRVSRRVGWYLAHESKAPENILISVNSLGLWPSHLQNFLVSPSLKLITG